jgi:hypothetical protein
MALPAGAAAQEATTSIPAPTTSTAAPGAATTTDPGASTTTAPGAGATTTAPPAATTIAPAPAPQTAPAPTVAPAPAQPAATDSRNTAAILLMFVVAGILLAVAVLTGLAHWQAWEPPWLVRWRHATAEAGWRAGNAWAEFTDWLRLGR